MGSNRGRGSISSKQKIADKLFSILTRMKYLMHGNRIECYTCGKPYHYNEIHCGHFISRSHHITRWVEENARPQCVECNVHKHGNMEEFERRLDLEAPGLPEKLKALSREVGRHTSSDMDQLIDHLRKRIKECGGEEILPKR